MEFRIVKDIVSSVINTIEQTAIASVRSIKAHVFSTKIINFPKTQEVKGTVVVGNQKNVEKQLQKIERPLPSILEAIKAIAFPKSFEVSNFPKYPEPPRSVEVSNFPPPLQLKEIRVSNQPTEELQGIQEQMGKVEKAVKALKLDPTINVQAPKPERVVVPPAQVTLNEKEIDYEKLSIAIADKMPEGIDYKKIADAIGKKLAEGLVSLGGSHSKNSSSSSQDSIKIKETSPTDATKANPSLVVSYNAAGDVVLLEKTIGGTTYTKTFSNADTIVASTKDISSWS
jgi:hypothetical protein